MSFRALMIRKMRPADAGAVAAAFADHDRTDMPVRLGLSGRTLFHYHGLYAHLVEAGHDVMGELAALRDDPAFVTVDRRVARYLEAYDPARPSMAEARARAFYDWERR
jgi:hypothetical protein